MVGGPNWSTRKLSQLIDTLLKPFLKHIIPHSLDFFINYPRDADEDTETVKFDVTSL